MVFKIGKKTLKQNVNFYVPSLPIKLGTFYLYNGNKFYMRLIFILLRLFTIEYFMVLLSLNNPYGGQLMTKYYYDPTNNRGYIPGRYVNKVVYLLIIFFLGHFGIQYFYIGKNFKGLLCLLFCWTFIPSVIAVFTFVVTLFKPTNEHGDIFIHY